MKKMKKMFWGCGSTTLFLAPSNDGRMELLDYEYDTERIHRICGGKCYYKSESGLSGEGFFESYGALTPVGYYRVDTRYNAYQEQVEVANGIKVMVPYAPHRDDKTQLLLDYPVVIRVGNRTLIYVDFFKNMNEVLRVLLSGEELPKDPKVLKRHFVEPSGMYPTDIEISFYNLFGWNAINPWEFVTDLLQDYKISYPEERIYQILRIKETNDGFLRYSQLGVDMFATDLLKEDPCEHLETPFSGWELAEKNLLYKLRRNEVYIVGWALAEELYRNKVEQAAQLLPVEQREEFTDIVWGKLPQAKYVECEISIPKLLFFMNKEQHFLNVRKGIEEKISEEVDYAIGHYQFIQKKLEVPA